MIKVVLFDFYGVFIPDAYSAWLEANGLKREGIFTDLINLYDRGVITEADFLKQLSNTVGYEVQNSDIHSEIKQPDTRIIETIHALKPHYPVGLFSNASKKLRTKLDALELTPLFDEIIISSEIGHAKPSDEAFKIAISRLGVEPNGILFIDDNPRNVEAAGRHSIVTVHHTAAESTIEALRAHGVLR